MVDEVLALSLATCSAAVAAEFADKGTVRSGRHRRCLHLRCEICLTSRTIRVTVSCLFCISDALCRPLRRYASHVDGRSQKAGFAGCSLLQLSLDTSSTFLGVFLSTATTDKRQPGQ